MPAKSRKSAAVSERDMLHAVYMTVVRNFAVSTREVIDAHPDFPVERLLKKLARTNGLLAFEHVNGEKSVTWQSMFDYDNEDGVEEKAEAEFNAAFPAEVEKAPASKSGATGPRYSDKQIIDGYRLAVDSARNGKKMTNREIADAVGVKSPSYFAKVRREQGAALFAASSKAPATKGAAKVAKLANSFSGKAVLAAKPAPRKWTAEVNCGGQEITVTWNGEITPNDTLKDTTAFAKGAAIDALEGEMGSDASVIIYKQLAGDAEPKRDRSLYLYRDDNGKIAVQRGN